MIDEACKKVLRLNAHMMVMFTLLFSMPVTAFAQTNCPFAPNPNKNFFQNFAFAGSCYLEGMRISNGSGGDGGDTNAMYSVMGYQTNPAYQLLIISTFSNSRFMAIQADDSHLWPTASILDQDLLPLVSSMINPYVAGNFFIPGQQFATTVSFGAMTPTPTPGCGMTTQTLNNLNATQIHATGPTFPGHETGASTGGTVYVRRYLTLGPVTNDVILVRSTATGCPITIAAALVAGILVPSASTNPNTNQEEITDHLQYGTHPQMCFTPIKNDPNSLVTGRLKDQYIPDPNAYDTSYVDWDFSAAALNSLIAKSEFLQFQFNVPTVPPTPCDTTSACTRTGNEQMRYFSVSFINDTGGTFGGSVTLASLDDESLNLDANRNATLVVNITPGVSEPTALVNNSLYTYLDLTINPAWTGIFTKATIRNIAPNSTFMCSTNNVPPRTSEWNPNGGYMGTHGITVQHVSASQFPATPTIPARNDSSCANIQNLPAPGICPTGN